MFRYLLLNKPYNVICQFSQTPSASLTLKNYIPVEGVYPVGRLDQDSEGLVLLTNNGPLQHRLADPKFAHPRTYWVQVEGIPDPNALEQLRSGVLIKDYRTRRAQVQLLELEPPLPARDPPIRYRKSIPTSWLEMTLTEGKNRQVRRMSAKVGFPTLRLVRISLTVIGGLNLTLQGLEPGQWRELEQDEIKILERIARSR